MSIDIPDLDDRRFQDIVDEAKRRIPHTFPEWTNHNISDPGVALIELFAWMTEMTLFRLNQMPDRAMATLLESVGYQAFPARAATADLTFTLSGPAVTDVRIPAGTKVGTDSGPDGQVIFETERTLVLRQPEFVRVVASTAGGGVRVCTDDIDVIADGAAPPAQPESLASDGVTCFEGLDAAWELWDRTYGLLTKRQQAHWKPRDRFAGDSIHFGFDEGLPDALVRCAVLADLSGRGSNPEAPPVVWEASTPHGWARCTVTDDGTGGLNRSGTLDIQLPHDHSRIAVEGDQELYWLRLRVDVGACPMYRASPRLLAVGFSTVGGVARARHSELQQPEVLGVSSGRPGQRFVLSRSPVLPIDETPEAAATASEADDGAAAVAESVRALTVRGIPWRVVDSFAGAGDDDPVYTLDPDTGEIRFGPAVRDPSGPTRQHGAVPPEGARIVSAPYRVGGGGRGNVAAGRLRSLRSTVKYVDRVTNLRPATGGVDAESMDQALERAPMSVLAGDRAVTLDDFERVAADVARDAHLITARAPTEPGGPVRLLVVPAVDTHHSVQQIDDFQLTGALCERLRAHLEARRVVGQRVVVTTPYYQGVSVAVRVRCAPPSRPDDAGGHADERAVVRDQLIVALHRFVNPVVGGERGDGLGFGEVLTAERVSAVVRAVSGVRDVLDVALFEANLRTGRRVGPGRSRLVAPPDSLFLSFRHRVVVDADEVPS